MCFRGSNCGMNPDYNLYIWAMGNPTQCRVRKYNILIYALKAFAAININVKIHILSVLFWGTHYLLRKKIKMTSFLCVSFQLSFQEIFHEKSLFGFQIFFQKLFFLFFNLSPLNRLSVVMTTIYPLQKQQD